MQIRRLFYLLLGSFVALVPLTAATQDIISAKFRIDTVFQRGDSAYALIDGGAIAGIKPGQQGKFLNAVDDDRRTSDEVAFGIAINVFPDRTECFIKSIYNNNTLILEGDVVAFDIALPVRKYENLLYDIALEGILFTDFNDKPFNSLQKIAYVDRTNYQDSLEKLILKDVLEIAELLTHMQKMPASLNTVLIRGRFTGKSIHQALMSFTQADVHNFLLYAKAYPLAYMGYRFKISESIAGWILGGAPHSPAEIRNELLPISGNISLFREKIKSYEWSIKSENTSLQLAREASRLANLGQKKEGFELIAFAKQIAYTINDTAGKVSVHLLQAQMFQDAEQYKEAVIECESAVKLAATYNKDHFREYETIKRFEINSLIKKAFCLYKISKYSEARATLQIAQRLLDQHRRVLGDLEYLTGMGKRYNYEGTFDYLAGNYNSALENYIRTISINDSLNSVDAKTTNAELYYFKGKILNKQNKNREALIALKEAEKLYREQGRESSLAAVFTERGSSYFEMTEYKESIANLDEAYRISIKYKDSSSAGYAKSTVGNAYWNQGNYIAAIKAHSEAKSLRRNSNYGLAYSWNQLGQLYLLSGQKKDALKALDSAVLYYRKAGDSTQLAEVYVNKGKVYHQDENYLRAISYYEDARKLTEKVTAYTLYNMANAWWEIDTARAKQYFHECEALSRTNADNEYLFSSIQSLCKIAYANHNYQVGEANMNRMIVLASEFGSPTYEAHILAMHGYISVIKLELDKALEQYQHALSIYDTTSKSHAGWVLVNIADIYISRGEFGKAEAALVESRNIFKTALDQLGEGYSLLRFSLLQSFLGEYNKGMTASDSAIAIFTRSGNMLRLANAFVSKGSLYKTAGNYKAAIEIYHRADSIFKSEGTQYQRSTVLNDIGVSYFNQGDYNNAINFFNKSASFLQKAVLDENYILNRSNLAECYYYQKKYKQAEEILVPIYPLAEKKKLYRIANTMALTLGKISFEAGQLTKAAAYLQKAREMSNNSNEKSSMAEVNMMLGKVEFKLGHITEAQQFFTRATDIARNYPIGSSGWLTFYESGLFYYDQQRYDSAIAHLKIAVEKFENDASNIFGGAGATELLNNDPRKTDMYGKLTGALLKTNNQQEALVYANRSNLSALMTLSGPLSTTTGDAVKDAALKRLAELEKKKQTLEKSESTSLTEKGGANTDKLVAIQNQKRIIEAEYASYVDQLVDKYPDLNAYFRNIDENYYNYKKELPADVAVVMYQLNGNDLMIFTLTNEELFTYVAELDKGIYAAIRAFKSLTKSSDRASNTGAIYLRTEVMDEDEKPSNVSFAKVSNELYDLLIGSVEEKLAGKKRLCIIPNGELSNFAFQCLGKTAASNNFDFLLGKYSIFYSNQLDVFKNSGDARPVSVDPYSFAAFGVPDNTLRFNMSEVKSIGRIFGSDSTVYADYRATEFAAKNSLLNKRIVHFATHGVLSYTDFNQSYLKLLPDKDTSSGNNGRFTLTEIKKLAIREVELVTLSACETAVSQVKTNGWKISPANEFLKRSVKSVIASLWKVDDEATSLLMEQFYKNLVGGMEKVEALRAAQVYLSKNPRFAHPHYWGAFVLYGEWR